MKRRSFLAMLGIAPAVAALPAMATTSPRDPLAFRVSAKKADIGYARGGVQAGPMRSADGRLVFDFENGVLTMNSAGIPTQAT